MAFRVIGVEHHGSIPNNNLTTKIPGGQYRLLHQVGGSRSTGHHHGEKCAKLYIVCRYGIPRVLVLDNGKQFDNDAFRDFCSQLGIKNHYSAPPHLQANEQVEVTS